MRVVALAGGTGSAKLVRGLAKVSPGLTVIGNPGDNVWMHGLYVCPDTDTATYALSGIVDRGRGWGLAEDSFATLAQLEALGEPSWFRLGDKDLATHIFRTERLRVGWTLTEVSLELCKRLGLKERVIPATDDHLETRIKTDEGEMNLQEFWVQRRAEPKVRGVLYQGAKRAHPTKQVAEAMRQADLVVICPGNPVTSIGPILAVGGMKQLLRKTRATVVAVSPMVGRAPFSGPAGMFMTALGARPDSVGVAGLYAGVVERLFIHSRDSQLRQEIEDLGLKVVPTNTLMEDEAAEVRLASELTPR